MADGNDKSAVAMLGQTIRESLLPVLLATVALSHHRWS
jgi:hypothetical protein